MQSIRIMEVFVRRMPFAVLFPFLAAALLGCARVDKNLHNGDLVFQVSDAPWARALALASGSKYTNVGMVFYREGLPYVLEAAQPAHYVLFKDWVAKGLDGHVVVKRLKERGTLLPAEKIMDMRLLAREFLHKAYDPAFAWSDERMYCSELVWKIYRRAAGIEIGETVRLRDLKLDAPLVASVLRRWYGDDPPLNDRVITPGAMFRSDKLLLVFEN